MYLQVGNNIVSNILIRTIFVLSFHQLLLHLTGFSFSVLSSLFSKGSSLLLKEAEILIFMSTNDW